MRETKVSARVETGAQGFEECFSGLLPVALGAARRIVGSGPVAEDVAAEALARLWVRWRRLGQADHRDAWLVRVATNLALDQVRRKEPAVVAAAPGPDAAEAVVARDSVIRALVRLPRRQREVLVLRHLYDLSVVDTAGALGISANSVKRHQQRAFAALRALLGPDHEPEELRDAF